MLSRSQADGAPLTCASLGRFISDVYSSSSRNNIAASQTRMKGGRRHLAAPTRGTATGQVKMGDVQRKVVQCFFIVLFSFGQFFTPRNRNTKIETHKLTDIGKSINTERKSSKSDGKVESQQNITGLVEVQRKLVESV